MSDWKARAIQAHQEREAEAQRRREAVVVQQRTEERQAIWQFLEALGVDPADMTDHPTQPEVIVAGVIQVRRPSHQDVFDIPRDTQTYVGKLITDDHREARIVHTLADLGALLEKHAAQQQHTRAS
jgi:hypothetical protein